MKPWLRAAPVAAVYPPTSASAQVYIVKKGDSLWKIAKAENVTVGELSRANNTDEDERDQGRPEIDRTRVAKAEKTNVATASVVPTSTDASSVVRRGRSAADHGDADSGNLYVSSPGIPSGRSHGSRTSPWPPSSRRTT